MEHLPESERLGWWVRCSASEAEHLEFVGERFGSLGVLLAVDSDPDVERTRGGGLVEEKFGGRVVDGEVGEMDDAVESDAELAMGAAKGPTVALGDIRDKGGDGWSTEVALSPALAVAERLGRHLGLDSRTRVIQRKVWLANSIFGDNVVYELSKVLAVRGDMLDVCGSFVISSDGGLKVLGDIGKLLLHRRNAFLGPWIRNMNRRIRMMLPLLSDASFEQRDLLVQATHSLPELVDLLLRSRSLAFLSDHRTPDLPVQLGVKRGEPCIESIAEGMVGRDVIDPLSEFFDAKDVFFLKASERRFESPKALDELFHGAGWHIRDGVYRAGAGTSEP